MSNSFSSQWDRLQSEWDALGVEQQRIASLGFEDVIDKERCAELQDEDLEEETLNLRAEWAVMSPKRRAKLWERFTRDIDEGVSGWNRLYPILWPAYERGASIL